MLRRFIRNGKDLLIWRIIKRRNWGPIVGAYFVGAAASNSAAYISLVDIVIGNLQIK